MKTDYKEGDRVSVTTTKRTRLGINIGARDGRIVGISEHPDCYQVKLHRTGIVDFHVSRIRPINQPNALTECLNKFTKEM